MNSAIDEDLLKEFKSLLGTIRALILEANTSLDIWEQLHPTEDVVNVFNAYRGFFRPTREAHLDRFFIKTAIVVSEQPNAASLYRLLHIIMS